MVGLTYSPQIKAAIKYDLETGRTDGEIVERHQVSKSLVYRYRKHWEEWGEVSLPPFSQGGRRRALDLAVSMALLDYLEEKPTAYLDEMRFFLFDAFDVLVDESTISRELKRLGFSRKKCRRVAAQRCQDLRDHWMQRLVEWRGDQLIYLDESAACERTGKSSLLAIIDTLTETSGTRSTHWIRACRHHTYRSRSSEEIKEVEHLAGVHIGGIYGLHHPSGLHYH